MTFKFTGYFLWQRKRYLAQYSPNEPDFPRKGMLYLLFLWCFHRTLPKNILYFLADISFHGNEKNLKKRDWDKIIRGQTYGNVGTQS